MSIACEMAAPFVANSAVEGAPVARLFRSHVDSCLKCQARGAVMSRTARILTSLEGETNPAPMDLEWRVMSSLEGDLALARSSRAPLALLAAIASMAAALIIWRLSPRTAG